MSIFRTVTLECPACATPISMDLVISVSADRRPDLRDAILDGSFQCMACPSCATVVRADPEFTYMDIARAQYLGVWPADKRSAWQEWAAKTRQVFDDTLGANATPEAKRLGVKVDLRTVFGWPALVEKILVRQAGIDDVTLEVAKLAVMRTSAESPLPGELELRLVAVGDSDLTLAWIGGGAEASTVIRVPRQLLADIDAEAGAWQAVRARVAEGDVVDFQREMLVA